MPWGLHSVTETRESRVELTKSLHSCQIKSVNADEGIIEAIVSVFNNVDSVGDRVKLGFFAESLQR